MSHVIPLVSAANCVFYVVARWQGGRVTLFVVLDNLLSPGKI